LYFVTEIYFLNEILSTNRTPTFACNKLRFIVVLYSVLVKWVLNYWNTAIIVVCGVL